MIKTIFSNKPTKKAPTSMVLNFKFFSTLLQQDVIRACLVDCNRYYNVIDIPRVQLFFSLVMFLLQGIIIPCEQLFFKMRNNYSSLKGCISYFLVSVITSKLNIFPNKQTFHIHLTIKKKKKIIENNTKFKNNNF